MMSQTADPQSSSEPKPLLDVSGLGKAFATRMILNDLNFSVQTGERVALMGPSGSGKSTLLNCLGGLDRPDTGKILLNGRDITALDGEALAAVRRREVTHIFQFFHLLPTLTARENIAFPLHLCGVPKPERDQRVASLLAAVGLESRAEAPPSQLSGGEMQRVAIARALAPRPALILADEPTGNLDSVTGGRILDLLESLCSEAKTALLLVTHDPHTTRICARTLHLLDGRMQTAPAS